jgi:uncharacterized membrane protein
MLAIWITGFSLPLITSINNPFGNFLLKKLYSTTCHQESFKCFYIGNAKMLVCARCAGIYFGSFVSSIFSFFIVIPLLSKKLLVVSMLPMLIDVFLTSAGVYTYSQILSFITGFIFGIVIYLFTILEIEKFILNKK